MPHVTVARLREALAPSFPGVDTVFRRLRQGGVLPAGTAGRNGVGSAQLEMRQAALALIALASGVAPIEAPTEARRIGGYVLRARAVWLSDQNRWFARYICDESRPTYLDFLEGEHGIARGALPNALPGKPFTFAIGPEDLAAVMLPPESGGGMLLFTPDEPGPPQPATERVIHGSVIATVASLFGPVEQSEISPVLAAQAHALFGLASIQRGA